MKLYTLLLDVGQATAETSGEQQWEQLESSQPSRSALDNVTCPSGVQIEK
jgi:hypothetical protein